MRKTKKFLYIVTIFLIIILINNIAYALGIEDFSGSHISNASATNFANVMISVLTTLGSAISVIVLVIIGIKYMTGSVEEKATYKSSLMPYVIGAVLVFAASSIAGIVFKITQNLGN